ncbi:MAG: RNA polymerase sigma factor [Planctomycetes bacterium]|nr:RNA polymerase sigma factor [Planctomycetota bacterium]
MNGSSATWEALLAERAWLARLARELVRGEAEAEELAGDVLADASVQDAPRRAGPRAWLRALARRQAALRERSARRLEERERRAARNETQPSALEAAAAFEVQRAVAEAVAALEEPFRTTVLLRTWENLPPREVARVMGCPVETVHSRTKRAHEKLRAALDAHYAGRRDGWAVPLFLLQQRLPRGTESGLLLGVALGGGGKLGLALAAAACAIAVGIWLAPRATPLPPELSVRAGEERDPLMDAPRASTAERMLADSLATAEPVPQEALVERFLVRGRVIADEDERPLLPLVAYLRGSGISREELTLRVGPAPEMCFEVALTLEQATRIRELGFELAERAPLRRSLQRETLERASEHALDLGALRSLRGSSYAGHVVDGAGRAVAGARLLVPRTRVGWGAARHAQNLLADAEGVGTTDANGRFVLRERIEAAVAHTHLFAVTVNGLGWARIAPTRGGAPPPDELSIRLRPNGVLVARVLDEQGEPLVGARVVVRPRWSPLGVERLETVFSVANDPLVSARFEAVSDEHGIARFATLPFGDPAEGPSELWSQFTVRVEADAGPCGPWYVVRLEEDREVEIELRARAGEIEVEEQPGAPPIETRVLSGRATDASGAPARGFLLFVGGRCLAQVGADGTFRVEQFPLGPQQVVLAQSPEAGPGWTGRYTPEVVDAAAGSVHFVLERRPDPGLELRFEHRCALPPTGTLEIELVAGEQALPESVTLQAALVKRDSTGMANFTYAGMREASSAAEVLGDLESPWLQSLRVRPALGRRVVLHHADTTQPVRIEARAGDLRGSVEVQAHPHTVVRTILSIK